MPPFILCCGCGKIRRHYAKGFCKLCYQKDYNKRYYAEHTDAERARKKEWYYSDRQKHSDIEVAHQHRRRAKKDGLPHDFTLEQWEEVLKEYEYRCAYCGKGLGEVDLLQEHKVPASRGGGYTRDNIVPACPECNLKKGSMTDEEFLISLGERNEISVFD